MNVINFEQKCEKARRYLDSYVSNELLVETNHELMTHLESCKDCSQALEVRMRVKTALQRAVRNVELPPALEARVKRIRDEHSRGMLVRSRAHWAFAVAAMALLVLGGWVILRVWNLQGHSHVETLADRILTIGAGNHLTCAINHQMWKQQFSSERMARELGPDYIGLVSLAKEKAPQDFEVVVAHRCHVDHRGFVHMILRKQDSILSVILTKKSGESFHESSAPAVVKASGVSIFRNRLKGVEVAGFETRDYLAFVVSDLDPETNLKVAANLAPSVRDYLAKQVI
jgi:hypothetical protein